MTGRVIRISVPARWDQGYSSFEPMQNLVDAYWDIDGKTVRSLIPMETRKTNFEVINAEGGWFECRQPI